jgi:hypothetical protein
MVAAALAAVAVTIAAQLSRDPGAGPGPGPGPGPDPDPGPGPGPGAGAVEGPYPVIVHRPDGPPRVESELADERGEPVTVACSTCHSLRAPDPANRIAADLGEFHQGLTFVHGTTVCGSCHGAARYDALRLADGRALPFPEVMTLCGQCHGRQAESYEHGAHGGMTGYWDLLRGPRARNGCTDCHDPHAPAFPAMRPTFKPRDRFLDPSSFARGAHD